MTLTHQPTPWLSFHCQASGLQAGHMLAFVNLSPAHNSSSRDTEATAHIQKSHGNTPYHTHTHTHTHIPASLDFLPSPVNNSGTKLWSTVMKLFRLSEFRGMKGPLKRLGAVAPEVSKMY